MPWYWLPSGNVTVTSAFGSVLPVTILSPSVIGSTWGLFGAFLSTTEITTSTSSLDPSGYITTTVAFLFPGIPTSTFSFQTYIVPFGRSDLFLIPSDASGSLFNSVVTFWPLGVYLSASERLSVTSTGTFTVSFVPSGYVTSMTPS